MVPSLIITGPGAPTPIAWVGLRVQELWDGAITFRYKTPEEVLEHLRDVQVLAHVREHEAHVVGHEVAVLVVVAAEEQEPAVRQREGLLAARLSLGPNLLPIHATEPACFACCHRRRR